jgi:hypothetical protein
MDKTFEAIIAGAKANGSWDKKYPVYAADTAIVQTLLPTLYSIIDRLLDGQDKALVIEARRVLPKTYKNSFEKGKGV